MIWPFRKAAPPAPSPARPPPPLPASALISASLRSDGMIVVAVTNGVDSTELVLNEPAASFLAGAVINALAGLPKTSPVRSGPGTGTEK